MTRVPRLSSAQLDLSGNKLGSEGATALAPVIAASASLTKILVGSNELGEEGTRVMCEALKNNKVVKELDLSGGSEGNIGGPAGAKRVADMLLFNSSLTSVWTPAYESL